MPFVPEAMQLCLLSLRQCSYALIYVTEGLDVD